MSTYQLHKGEAVLADLKDGLLALGIPLGMNSRLIFFDPTNGSDGNDGSEPSMAVKSIETAYALATDNNNDTILMIAGATASNPTAAIAWAKSYTHLVGLSAPLPGLGQRCRIVGTAALDLAQVITISGNGCVFMNLQFFNGSDANAAKGAVVVSGSRNYFKNVFFAGMGHATCAGHASAYSLTVSGAENYFEDCTIGLDTILRSAANSELIISAERNRFVHCELRSYCETAGKFLVKIDNSTADLRDTIFEDCLFFNYTVNWANGIDNAFDMPAAGNTHFVILKGDNVLVGVNSGWADTVTHVYSAAHAPNAGFGIATNPTT
jgi:hypothetical protein